MQHARMGLSGCLADVSGNTWPKSAIQMRIEFQIWEEDNVLEWSVSVRENWDSSKATMDTVIWSIFKDHVKKENSLCKAVKEHNVDTTTALRVRNYSLKKLHTFLRPQLPTSITSNNRLLE